MIKKENYDNILKSTSIFGSVQFIQVFFTIIRTKIFAIYLGPLGIGMIGLYNGVISMISAISNFGLSNIATKNIAEEFGETKSNSSQFQKVVNKFRGLALITGLLGTVLCIVFSQKISQVTFKNDNYTIGIVLISIVVLFNQLYLNENAITQGTRNLKILAKSQLISSVLIFIVCIPLVMLWGMQSILLIVLMVPMLNLSVSLFYNHKLGFEFRIKNFSNSDFRILNNLEIIKNGFLINLSNIALILVGYLTRLIIVQLGSVEDVGLFNAEYAIVASYFGMIFSAMTTDYYPNLSAISNDKFQTSKLVNENIEMSILILTPIILFFIIFIKQAIIILYSNAFLGMTDMIKFSSIGVFFKASSWSIAYLFIVKNKLNQYFFNEILANFYMLFLNLIGYKYLGLTGLGISFCLGYFLYFIQMLISSKWFLGFVFEQNAVKIFLIQFCLVVLGTVVSFLDIGIYRTVIGSLIFIISLVISIKIINKHSSFKNSILSKFKR